LILVWNIIYSARRGEKVGKDPWGGWSLEWTTTSPPPTPSFHDIPTQLDANEGHEHEEKKGVGKRLWEGSGKEVTQ
jgi:cytochrome c oxidase subunit 1